MSIFGTYRKIPLVYKLFGAFLLGIGLGFVLETSQEQMNETFFSEIIRVLSVMGSLLVFMLKMIVIPLIFFSLANSTTRLSLKKFGRLGIYVLCWYAATSLFAATFGTLLAKLWNPSMIQDTSLTQNLVSEANVMRGAAHVNSIGDIFIQLMNGLFMNPFEALATGQFLSVIVCALLFGLAVRSILDADSDAHLHDAVDKLRIMLEAFESVIFKIVSWILEYLPIGVFALTTVNFALYGKSLIGPYFQIAGCVTAGVLLMIFIIYPLLILLFCHENPYKLLLRLKEPIVTAFVTRSSGATLPVSLAVAEKELHVDRQLSGFMLPLGATINMDGVCIHLPVFAILAANIFGIQMGTGQIFIIVLFTVLASIGAGGIPGGSLFLLFLLLDGIGLSTEQSSIIVALAIGINPLLDMFETACNVAGDNVGNYIIGKRSGMTGKQ